MRGDPAGPRLPIALGRGTLYVEKLSGADNPPWGELTGVLIAGHEPDEWWVEGRSEVIHVRTHHEVTPNERGRVAGTVMFAGSTGKIEELQTEFVRAPETK